MRRPTLRWRRKPRETGLLGAISNHNRGWQLRYGTDVVAWLDRKNGGGWYWVAVSKKHGVPLRNTAAEGRTIADWEDARKEAAAYVRECLRKDHAPTTPPPEQSGEWEHSSTCRTITGKVNDGYCAVCRRRTLEQERGMGEPFCACGRRTGECDGSRAGCRKTTTSNGGR